MFPIRHVAALLSKVATLLAGTSGCIFNSSRPFSSVENGSKMDETGKMEAMAHLVQGFTQASWFQLRTLKVAEGKLGDVHQNHLGWFCQGDVEKCCGASNFEVGYGTNIYQEHLFQRGGHQPASWRTVESKEELKKTNIYDTVTFR